MGWLADRRARRRSVEPAERRAPSAATKALQFVPAGRAQPPNWDAAVAFERAYYQNVVVYACLQAIASSIAGLEFRAGLDPAKPHDHDPDAPLAQLLGPPPGGPNPSMDAETLWHYLLIQYLVTGRAAAEIEVDSQGRPIALWPLVSSRLTPIPTTSGVNWFAGFLYGRPEDQRRLPADRVLYVWQPSGTDFRQPESALQAAHLDINIAVMQSHYDYAFLRNDARPAAVVVTEAFESDDDFAAFRDQFEARHRGPDNAGRLAFVEAKNTGDQGVKGAVAIETLGFSPKDSESAARHAAAMQRIAIALGVPWSRLDASNRTFDNASEEDKIWWQQRLLPLIRRFQGAVNIQLAPRLGREVGWFDLSKVQALQPQHERLDAQGAAVLYRSGIITKDEAREPFGLPAVGEGFIDTVLDVPDVPADRVAPEPPVSGQRAPDPVPVLTPPEAASTPDDTEARRVKIWTAADRTVRNLETIFESGARKLFERQRRSVIARLNHRRARPLLARRDSRELTDEVFDPDHWRAETVEQVRDYYEMIAAASGDRVARIFDIGFDVQAPYAQQFIAERANQLAGQVTDTTYNAIKAALHEGTLAGESIPKLAARIDAVFDEATRVRATRIARTETISAYNGSATAFATSLGSDVVGAQEWIATRDPRTREDHALADGQVVPVGQRFQVGGESLAYPGDPSGSASNTVNCRCTIAFWTPEEAERHFGISSTPRGVPLLVARALLATVQPGQFDEPTFRAAVEVAA